MKINKEGKGALYIVLAVLMYGLYAVFTRFIYDYFGAFTQNYLRAILIALFFTIYILFNKKKWRVIVKEDLKWLLVWTLSGSTTVVLAFVAFNNLPISTAYFIFYSTMIITGYVVGGILFKEKMNIAKAISILLLIVGLLSIYTLQFDISLITYVFIALLLGLLVGFWNTTSKKLSNKYSTIQLTLIGAVVTGLISILGALVLEEPIPAINNGGWLWIIVFAITEILATFFVILGFKNLEAQIASTIMPLEIVFATFFGVIFFREYLNLTTIIGGILILTGAMLPSIWELKKKSPNLKTDSKNV